MEPTRPDLLARIYKLPMSAQQFMRMAEVPCGTVHAMKMGQLKAARGIETLAKVEAALARAEGGESPPPAFKPGPAPLSTDPNNVSPRAMLAAQISEAHDIDSVDACNAPVSSALLDGSITVTEANSLKGLLAERRQSTKAKAVEAAALNANDELTIRVVFVKGWTGGPLPREMDE